jgi:hypothetical protein
VLQIAGAANWVRFFDSLCKRYGPDGTHPSCDRPGRGLALAERWETIDRNDAVAMQSLRSDIDTETESQPCPIHSVYWELRRAFVAWAKGNKCETQQIDADVTPTSLQERD